MNNIDEMPAKCKSCPYWEACEYPGICQDTEPKLSENGDLISRRAALDALNVDMSGVSVTISGKGAEKVYGYVKTVTDRIKALPPAPAIPLAWIDGYIQTCEIFDLRANVPASKVIKTMVKIWEQENQGKKKGGEA